MKVFFKDGSIVEVNIPENNKDDVLIVNFDEQKHLMHFRQENRHTSVYYTRLTAVTDNVLFIDYENADEASGRLPTRARRWVQESMRLTR